MRSWINRQRYLIDFTLLSLRRRWGRTLVLLSVYTLVVFLLASVMLFSSAIRHQAQASLVQAPDVVVQRLIAGRHDVMPASAVATVAGLRGVQSATGRLWGYYFDTALRANYTIMVPPAGTSEAVAAGHAIVGATIARQRGIRLTEPLVLEAPSGRVFQFLIDRVLPATSELVSGDLVLLSDTDFRTFFDYPPGQYTDIAAAVVNPQERHTIAEKIVRELPETRAILRDDVLRTYESVFDWREGIVLVVLAGAVLAFAILALDKASGLPADEVREIGILKAIGWDTGDVVRMKTGEGGLISLTAFLIGYVAAYLHVFHGSLALFEPVLKGWSVLYPRIELTPAIDGLQIATLFFFTVVPYTAATVVPVWRAAITDPETVMRGWP